MVTVRTFVGAFIGPTLLLGRSGFFWIKDVRLARPLYSPVELDSVAELEEPRSCLADMASFAFSSYQLLCLVASFALVMLASRFAV